MRSHLLICRAPQSGDQEAAYVTCATSGREWRIGREPKTLSALLATIPALLRQLTTHDFTMSPFREFSAFDRSPDEFALPAGKPVVLGCPDNENAREHWGWLSYYCEGEPPMPVGERFAEALLQDAVERQLKLNDATTKWAADREIWVRHDLTQADLI